MPRLASAASSDGWNGGLISGVLEFTLSLTSRRLSVIAAALSRAMVSTSALMPSGLSRVS